MVHSIWKQAQERHVMDQSYVGFYARFETASKNQGSLLMGPDFIVGDDAGLVQLVQVAEKYNKPEHD